MATREVIIPVDHYLDLGDNFDRLINKLLEMYPQLTEI